MRINGKFVPSNEAYIHVFTHSLNYAGAVFEGERAYNGKVFKLEEHTKRLLKSAQPMGLEVKYGEEEINQVTRELLEKNSLKDAYVRPLIWRGEESMGIYSPELSVNLLITAVSSRIEPLINLKLNLGSWCKPSSKALPPQAKSSALYAIVITSPDHSIKTWI